MFDDVVDFFKLLQKVDSDVSNKTKDDESVAVDKKPRPPVTSRRLKNITDTGPNTSVVELAKRLEGSCRSDDDDDKAAARPPVSRRSPTQKQAPVPATRTPQLNPCPGPPRLPPPSLPAPRLPQPRPDHHHATLCSSSPTSSSARSIHDENIAKTLASRSTESHKYSYASEDMMWRKIGLNLCNKGQDVSIPADCDVSRYTTEQLVTVMGMMNLPRQLLKLWYELGVDGRVFAEMSDDQLRAYNVDQPLIRQLRNCSRDSLRDKSTLLDGAYVTLTPNKHS